MGNNIRWVIILVSAFMIISLFPSVVDLWERRKIIDQEQQRLTELNKKHEELTKKFEMVQTPAFIEKEARERLGMAKAGETIILTDQTSQADTPRALLKESGDGTSVKLPYWKRWWQVFF